MILKKDSLKFINNAVFKKILENVRNHTDVTVIATKARKNHLVSYNNKKNIDNFLAIEKKKVQILLPLLFV